MPISHTDIEKTEEITLELIRLMKVDLKPEVSADMEGIKVNLVGKDTAIIIGFHGETLSDFAYVLGNILRHKLGKEFSLRVDSGEYLKNKDRKITDMAEKAIEKVKRSGFPETLAGLNSYERRLVHGVATKEGLTSESTGYGSERKLVIKPGKTSE
jgi:spoIIIJ-associated protein